MGGAGAGVGGAFFNYWMTNKGEKWKTHGGYTEESAFFYLNIVPLSRPMLLQVYSIAIANSR